MITRKQAVIAIYGEVLNLVELIDLLTVEAQHLAGQAEYSKLAGQMLTLLERARGEATAPLRRAVETLYSVIPGAEIHPLTGDLLDPPQG